MNDSDIPEAIRGLARVHRQWGDWRNRTLSEAATALGTSPEAEAAAMRRSWLSVLIDVTNDEVLAVLEQVEQGRVSIPFEKYGDAHRIIASEVRKARSASRASGQNAHAADRRYTCLECMDSGLVTIYNPKFVEWLRPQFEQRQEQDLFPSGWHREARAEWYRKLRSGEVVMDSEVSVACNCNCERAIVFRRQIEAYRSNQSPRSAVNGVWNPNKMPRRRQDYKSDLAEWYAEHDAASAYEWEPTAAEYESRFN